MQPQPSIATYGTAAWMRLPSGARINLLRPNPASWSDHDLAVRLSRVPRWAGETVWPRSMSVAQHSLLVLAIRDMLSPAPLPPSERLRELLHDAEEGLMGFDCISPLKQCLGEPFRSISRSLMAAIEERYELPAWTPADHAAHKRADCIAAASEAVHIAGWSCDEVAGLLQIKEEPLATVDPLASVAASGGYQAWEPWHEEFASDVFSDALAKILEQRRDRNGCLPATPAERSRG